MKGMIGLVVVASLLGAGCSRHSELVPTIDDSTGAQLQARAFQRACSDVICAGAPIYAPDSTPEAVRQLIVTQFTDEVQYLSDSDREQRTSPEGRFFDGATMISVQSVRTTGRDDVTRVDVGISKGYHDFTGRSYLFLWDDGRWVDTSPDAVNVTVTSSVS